ncbi:MAG TPA: hypothetical protein VJG90_01475 [Candidatus Nanoarchaeia archaeon]|nr:hypothetical protein [Candidatus Nanoarchaeia archaeon]
MAKYEEDEYQSVKEHIIKTLYGKKAFRKGHLLFERLQGGIAKHLRVLVPYVLANLIREGIVIHYGRTKHGYAYQLNIEKLREIKEITTKATQQAGGKNGKD